MSRISDELVYTEKRLKVLVSAYACDPDEGSEPGMGFNWVRHLAQHHDLWVLIEENRYRPAMTAYLDSHPEMKPHINFIGIRRQRYGEAVWSHLYYWTYMLWQWNAYCAARKLHEEINFDLVHQLNMIGYREPGFLWKLQVPFVWGPIGGHVQMPCRFLSSLGLQNGVYYGLRNILNWVQMHTSIRVRKAMKCAAMLIAATPEDRAAIKAIHHRDAKLVNETGVEYPWRHWNKAGWDGKRPLKLVWCGNFLAGKALPLGLHALSKVLKTSQVVMHIIGSGICESKWKKIAESLHLNSACIWYGMLPHSKALEVISTCDAMLFSSLKDATSTVVLEALQYGLPVICHDTCGFGAVIDETCGIKIPVRSPEHSISEFAVAILKLATNPDLLSQMSIGAVVKAGELAWPEIGRIMAGLYRAVLEKEKNGK